MTRIEMHLLDGRVLDLSGLTLGEILARLEAERITPAMVRATYHFVEIKQ